MRVLIRNMVLWGLGLATLAYVFALPFLLFSGAIGSMESGDSLAFALTLVLGVPGLALLGLWAIGIVILRVITARQRPQALTGYPSPRIPD
jgi:hypothetical protein